MNIQEQDTIFFLGILIYSSNPRSAIATALQRTFAAQSSFRAIAEESLR